MLKQEEKSLAWDKLVDFCKSMPYDISLEDMVRHIIVSDEIIEEIRKNYGIWTLETSSGYPGYRCLKCGEWVYLTSPKICSCKR